jgi:hypothetical protein
MEGEVGKWREEGEVRSRRSAGLNEGESAKFGLAGSARDR